MAQVTTTSSAISVAVLDACRALHAAVHDPPRFVQTLPMFCSSLFGLESKAWLDEPAENTVRDARDAVASVVGGGSEVIRVLIESRGRPVLGWPAARLPPRLRSLLVPSAQRPPRLTPPSFIPAVVPPNAPHLPLDLFLYYFFAFMTYARNHNPYPTSTTTTSTSAFTPGFMSSATTSTQATSSVITSPLLALSSSAYPRNWLELYLALWRQYLSLLLGGTSAAGALSSRVKSADGAFVEAAVELLLRGAENALPGGAYVLPTVLHLQLLCLLVESLVNPPPPFISSSSASGSSSASASAASSTASSSIAPSLPSSFPRQQSAGGISSSNSTQPSMPSTPGAAAPSSPFSAAFRSILPSSPTSFLRTASSTTPAATASVSGAASVPAPSSSTSVSTVSAGPHPLLALTPRPLFDFLSTAISHLSLLPPAQLQLFVRLWRLYLVPAVSGSATARRTYVHNNLAFYTTLLESFLTSLHANAHNTQPEPRLLDQLGAVLADLLLGIFDVPELIATLRSEESALGPGAVPPPAPTGRAASLYTPLFYNAAQHPQRAYFCRLAVFYSRERGVSAALRQALEITDAELGAVVRASPSAPAPVEPEMGPNGRLTERGAEQVRQGLRKCSPLNVPPSTVPLWHRPIGSREWPFLVRLLYRIASLLSKVTGVPVNNIPLRSLASTEAHVLIAVLMFLLACAWWVISAEPSPVSEDRYDPYRYRRY